MDTYEIALNFSDPVHQGDRRKKSQQCYPAASTDSFDFHSNLWQTKLVLTLNPRDMFQTWYQFQTWYEHVAPRLGRCLWALQRGIRQEQGTPWIDQWRGESKSCWFNQPEPWPTACTPLESVLLLYLIHQLLIFQYLSSFLIYQNLTHQLLKLSRFGWTIRTWSIINA